jgi:site-specific DNA-methyltransferase (adenine-specific)
MGGAIDEYSVTIATLDANQRRKEKVNVVHGLNSKESKIGNFGDENMSPPPEYFDELFRVSKHQIIWGGNYFLLPPSRGFAIWKKSTVGESFSMAMCEYAWVSINANAKVFEAPPQGTTKDPRIHPTQKPIALYKWLLNLYANTGDKILDTHVGSASSLIACYDMGYDYIGFEIDKDFYQAAQKRMDAHMAQARVKVEE